MVLVSLPMRVSAAIALSSLLGLAACSSPKPPEAPKIVEKTPTERPSAARKKSGPSVESEIGALDKDATVRVFHALLPRIEKCQDDRRGKEERLDFLAGDIGIKVRIKADGTARWAYLTKSTLGDRSVETCILEAAKRASWPKPQGGEGIAENELSLPMKGDRDAVAWPSDKVVKEIPNIKGQLNGCRQGKQGTFPITAYVDKEGKVISAGAATPVEEADGAAECMVKIVRGWQLPSPGGFPAKVSFSVDLARLTRCSRGRSGVFSTSRWFLSRLRRSFWSERCSP